MSVIDTKHHSSDAPESTDRNEVTVSGLRQRESMTDPQEITDPTDGYLRLHMTDSQVNLTAYSPNTTSRLRRRLLLLILFLIATNQGTDGFQQWPDLLALIVS